MLKIIIMGSSDETNANNNDNSQPVNNKFASHTTNQEPIDIQGLLSNINPNDPNFKNILAMMSETQTEDSSKKKKKHKKTVESDQSESDSEYENNSPRKKNLRVDKNCCSPRGGTKSMNFDNDDDDDDDDDDDQCYEGELGSDNESDSSDVDLSIIVEQITDTFEQLLRDSNGNTLADIMSSQYNELSQMNQNIRKLTKVIAAASSKNN